MATDAAFDPATNDSLLLNGDEVLLTETYELSQFNKFKLQMIKGEVPYDPKKGVDYFGTFWNLQKPKSDKDKMFLDEMLSIPEMKAVNEFVSQYGTEEDDFKVVITYSADSIYGSLKETITL